MHSSKHTDMRQVRDSSTAQGQMQTHIKSATPVIALALDLSADKDTIFWLHYDCGQDEFYTSSQQPQFKPEDLNFRLMQWRAVTQKLLSLSPCPFCMHRAEFAAANQLFVSVWTPIPVPGTNSDRIGPVLCMQEGADPWHGAQHWPDPLLNAFPALHGTSPEAFPRCTGVLQYPPCPTKSSYLLSILSLQTARKSSYKLFPII